MERILSRPKRFTEIRGVWDEDPAMLKPLLDRNYALGINKLFFHVYTHNPWMNHRPGMTLDGIGLFFQRDQTWWEEAKIFCRLHHPLPDFVAIRSSGG